MRDLRADWKRWSRTERAVASVLVAAMAIAVPALPFLIAIH
ncbi:MAG: hypothetical protein JWL84_6150 [Rhodospirillales bacterium]|jgi:hypothetical protein|nr:hypothetical protein [Rhodospirillales bacterium]